MTDLSAFLGKITAIRGLSGDEAPVAAAIAEVFSACADDVTIDAMQNVIARVGDHGPRIMVTAHLDEIGLMATAVEDDGAVRFTRVGGVDPRILPGSRVVVHTDEGPMTGVIGALPPHLLSAEDRKQNYKIEKLYVDMGLAAERVRALVHPGTPIALHGPFTPLENNRAACKTIDDRGCVAVMLRMAEMLKGRSIPAQVFFVAAAQEEVGSIGAITSAWTLKPDIGIAIDVTHAETPGTNPDEVYPLDKVILSEGPNIHPGLHKHLTALARAQRVDAATSITTGPTWTDAAPLQISRAGVPTVLVEVPLKYMHTTVETVSLDVIEETARLLTAFLTGLDEKWEDLLCY